MNSDREARRRQAQRQRIIREVREWYPDYSDDEVIELVHDWVAEEEAERELQLAERRTLYGYPEDTLCVANCDDWGTGEGRYHGRI